MNDLKGIIILVFFAMPMIASMNIDCRGKAFHCVNSTHFMICVDLGSGVSTTMDDFTIPCPVTTVCHENNTFECDFPKIEDPPLQVIGVYKQSDNKSETIIVTNAVTAPTSTSETSVIQENVTATTMPTPEEVTSVLKVEILENIRNFTNVDNSKNTTETTLQITPSFTKSPKGADLTNNNTIIISATENNKNFESALDTSIDKTVNGSLSDKSQSIDTEASVIELINLNSTDHHSVSSTATSSNLLTSLDSLYDKIATTTEQYIAKQISKHDKNIENATGKVIITKTENKLTDIVITDEVSTTPAINNSYKNNVNIKIDLDSIKKSGNQNLAQQNSTVGSNNTSDLVSETNTKYLAPVQMINDSEYVTEDVSFQTTTDKNVLFGLVDLVSSDPIQNVSSRNRSSDNLIYLYDNNTATTVDQYNTENQYKNDEKIDTFLKALIPNETILSGGHITTERTNTTPIKNTNKHLFTEFKSNGGNTSTEKVLEMNTKYFIPVTMQTTTGTNFIPMIAEENITTFETTTQKDISYNDSLVVHTIIAKPLEAITTNTSTAFTSNVHQIDQSVNQSFKLVKYNTTDTINTTERVVYNTSSTDMIFNDKGTEPISLQQTAIEYHANEKVATDTLQNEFTAHVTDIISKLPSTNGPINVPNMENVSNEKLNSIYTTSAPYYVTWRSVTSTPVEDLPSQTDVVPNVPTKTDQTDNLYKKNLELNQLLLLTKNISTDTTERVNAIQNASITDIKLQNNNKKELRFVETVTKDLVNTTQSLETLQNKLQANVINELPSSTESIIINEPYVENVNNDILLSNFTTSVSHYNVTTTSVTETRVKDSIPVTEIVTNAPTETVTPNFLNDYTATDYGTTEKIIADQETVLGQDILNANLWTNNSQDAVDKTTIYLNNIENSATTPFPRELITETNLSDSVNSINQITNLDSNVAVTLNSLQTAIGPQTSPSTFNLTGNTNKSPQIPTIADSMKIFEQLTSKTPEIETSTMFQVDVKYTTNIKENRDLIKTTIPPQELTSQKMVKQIITASDPLNSTATTAGFTLQDLNIDWNDSGNKSIITTIDFNDVNKTETVNSINNTDSNNTTSPSSTGKSNKDESIKIMSVFDIVKSSVKTMPNKTEQTSSSPLSSDDLNIKIIRSRDSSVYLTTTDYIPGYNFVPVEESVKTNNAYSPINPETTMSLTGQNEKVVSTTSLPIIEANTENINKNTSTERTLLSTHYEYTNPPKTEIENVTEKSYDDIFSQDDILSGLSKQHKLQGQTLVIAESGSTPDIVLSSDGSRTTAVYDESTINKVSVSIKSLPDILVDKDTVKIINESPLFASKITETQTMRYDSTVASLPIFTTAQITTEPTTFTQATFIRRTSTDVPTEIQTMDLPQYVLSTEHKIIPQYFEIKNSTADITTETVNNSLTDPDSMVETIKINRGKVIEPYLGSITASDDMSNNGTVNNLNFSVKTVKNIIDHENIVTGTTYKKHLQNTTMTSPKSVDINKAEFVNHTENDWKLSEVNIESVKIKDSSIEEELPSIQNKNMPSPIITQIDPKDRENTLTAAITNTSNYMVEKELTTPEKSAQSKKIISNENKKSIIDSTVNANIKKPDVEQNKVRADFENITDNINDTTANITSSYRNLSLYNSTFNDELGQHLISTNHTITTEIQRHLNESSKQSNILRDGVTLNETTNNPNVASIKLDVGGKDKSAISVSAPVFSCTNYTRGKYADNKNCRKFYTCIGNLQPIIGICPNNTVFSEINKQCTKNLSHCVRNNQFRCLFEGRYSDFFKDNIYYICVKNSMKVFTRYKFQCQGDYYLNKKSVECEKKKEISTQSWSSGSETSNDESTSKIKLEKTKNNDFECENEGNFPYAKDCRKYYVCTKIKNVYHLEIKKCSSDEVYDKKKKKCVDSDSGEC